MNQLTPQRATLLFLLVVVLEVVVFDVAVRYLLGPEWMISKVMRAAGMRLPMLPLWVLLFFALLWLHLFSEDVP